MLLNRKFLAGKKALAAKMELVRSLWNLEGTMLRTILIIILILALLGSFPLWPYSTGWGYGPSGGLGLILLILIVLVVMGRL
jgi:Protein of unknown function (DUF3309)